MPIKILLVNPPIYDFSAYDFWLKPYGMLRVAGYLRRHAEFKLFDYLDRSRADPREQRLRRDCWGRGSFPARIVDKPAFFDFRSQKLSTLRLASERLSGLPKQTFPF
ncbi:MAG: hypothetical protein KatS3mg105_4481 [Gemmatales bacterium]|nr:MAG: hypothetical protein KatS3mg105_4481 [Gemmatales bacterium]